jgi:predicted aldo/keto reductase-like oxidoreductase
MNKNLERREFLKVAVKTVAFASVSARSASAEMQKKKKIEFADTIPARMFSKNGIDLPILGYGGAALPKIYGNNDSLDDRLKLVRYAYDRGIRYYDTAGNYAESQWIIGEALRDVRDNVFLATKVETTAPSQVRSAVEKSLRELDTDYLDLIQIHGTPGIEQMSVAQAMKIHAELVKLRDERIIRHIGFTAHSYFDKAMALIKTDGFDQCMLSYGYISRGYDQLHSDKTIKLRNECVSKAHELGMGIVAMKVMGAGVFGALSEYMVPGFDKKRLKQLPGAAIRYVLNDKRICMLAIGMRFKKEIDSNIRILASDTTYTSDDKTLLAQFSARALNSKPLKAMRID